MKDQTILKDKKATLLQAFYKEHFQILIGHSGNGCREIMTKIINRLIRKMKTYFIGLCSNAKVEALKGTEVCFKI